MAGPRGERATLVFEEAERVFDQATKPGVSEAQREEFIRQHDRLRLEHEALSAMFLRLRMGATLQ